MKYKKFKVNVNVLLLGLALCLILQSSTERIAAYEYWDDPPPHWEDVTDLDWKDYIDSYYQVAIRANFDASISDWEQATQDPDFDEVSSNEDVYVYDYYEESESNLGFTQVWWDSNDHFTYAVCGVNWYQYDIEYYDDTWHEQSVTGHELGHVLGLDHETGEG